MNITLTGFPAVTDGPLTVGEVVRGKVTFTAAGKESFSSIGYQLILTNTHAGHQDSDVRKTFEFDKSVVFAAGETRTFAVEFTVPDVWAHTGKLFTVRPGLRGYAKPVRNRNVVLRRPVDFYPTSDSWHFRTVLKPFRPAGELKLRTSGLNPAAAGAGCLLVVPAVIASFYLATLGPLGYAFALLIWVALGYYYLRKDEQRNNTLPPTVRLESRGQTLLAHLHYFMLPEGLTHLSTGYEVRELRRYTDHEGERILSGPAELEEPRQKIILDDEGRGMAEHQLLPLPGPGSQEDYGFEWVYVVEATIKGKRWSWEGGMERAVEPVS